MKILKVIERVIEKYQALVHEITDVTTGSSDVINKYKLRIDKLMQELDLPLVIVPSDLMEYPKFLELVAKSMDKELPAVTMNYINIGVPAGEMALVLHKHQKDKGSEVQTYLEEVSLNKASALSHFSLSDDVVTKLGKIFSYNEGKLDDDEVFIYMQDLDNLRVTVIRWLGIFNFLNTDLWWVRDND